MAVNLFNSQMASGIVPEYAIPLCIILAIFSIAVLLFVLAALQRRKPATALASQAHAEEVTPQAQERQGENIVDLDDDPKNNFPTTPHLQGVFQPFDGYAMNSNPKDDRGCTYENELCSGRLLVLHRPTHDPALDRSGDYPYAHVFNGRRINWEIRIQLQFKKDPVGQMMFGIELDKYVPLMNFTKRAMKMTVKAFKWVVGGDLYHSVGDDPETTDGELERPIFAMPFWALDQMIVTPEGEEPPHLNDPNFSQLGYVRSKSSSTFRKQVSDLKMRAGPTYTINFWSISQFMDDVMWKISGVVPGVSVDFNQFCGRPPVHLVIYSNEPNDSGEERQLKSRRRSYFHLAFWSSVRKPARERIQQIMSTGSTEVDDGARRAPAVGARPRKTLSVTNRKAREGFTGCMAGIVTPICGSYKSGKAAVRPVSQDNVRMEHPNLLTPRKGKPSDKMGARALLQEMIKQS